MTTKLLIVALAVLVTLPGCGGSSAEVQVSASRFRPPAQPSAAFAAQQGWKKGNEPNAPARVDEPAPLPTPERRTDPPGDTGTGTNEKDPDGTVVAGVDNPGGGNPTTGTPTEPTDPEPKPDPNPPADPDPEGLAPAEDTLDPSHQFLAGRWRGDLKHYVLEKEEWVEDQQLFIVEFREVQDAEGNPVPAVQIYLEVEGNLQRVQEPTRYDINAEARRGLFVAGNQSVTIRAVGKDRIEIRGQVRGFTVIRYYKRILGG